MMNVALFLGLCFIRTRVAAFVAQTRSFQHKRIPHRTPNVVATTSNPRNPTTLHSLVDVPYGFFTLSLPALGILLSFSRNVARVRLEERAWEQRVAAAQQQMDDQTELDIRRDQAEAEWSAYGGDRRKTATTTADPPYDPYYDEPYPEDELPEDRPYSVDRVYGDRIYEDGEIFYKDAESGMYYRQGSKPRVRFFR